jgi:hypothetical protein
VLVGLPLALAEEDILGRRLLLHCRQLLLALAHLALRPVRLAAAAYMV